MASELSAKQNPVADELHREVLRLVARQAPASQAIAIVNAAIVYFILREVTDRTLLWSWFSAVVGFSALRIVMVVWFFRASDRISFRTWTWLWIVLVCASGVCWGLLPLFDAFYAVEWVSGFIIFVIAGMAAGGALSLYVMLPAAIPWFLGTLIPLVIVLASGDEFHHFAQSLLASLFLVMLVRTSISLNAQMRRSIRLEVENRQLFDFLSKVQSRPIDALSGSGAGGEPAEQGRPG